MDALLDNLHPCSNVTLPKHTHCYPDDTTKEGYRLGCLESCPEDCISDNRGQPACATDLGTYPNPCEMSKAVCNFYFDLKDDPELLDYTDIDILHMGPCSEYLYYDSVCLSVCMFVCLFHFSEKQHIVF